MKDEWIIDALEKNDFVYVKKKNERYLRLKSVAGLTLVATIVTRWVRDDLIEETKEELEGEGNE
jgi:hypothetical protein